MKRVTKHKIEMTRVSILDWCVNTISPILEPDFLSEEMLRSMNPSAH